MAFYQGLTLLYQHLVVMLYNPTNSLLSNHYLGSVFLNFSKNSACKLLKFGIFVLSSFNNKPLLICYFAQSDDEITTSQLFFCYAINYLAFQ